MNRYELEVFAGKRYGRSIGWMCNVINTGHSSPASKIKGLIFLAFHDRIAPMAYCIDQIMIDGYVVSWSELEKYAGSYREDEEAMLLHIDQLPEKTVHTLYDAKLLKDSYHENIQSAARAIMAKAESDMPRFAHYSSFTYGGQYSSGNSFWSSTDETALAYYDVLTGELLFS